MSARRNSARVAGRANARRDPALDRYNRATPLFSIRESGSTSSAMSRDQTPGAPRSSTMAQAIAGNDTMMSAISSRAIRNCSGFV